MPFSKDARGVSGIAEVVCDRWDLGAQEGATTADIARTISGGVDAGEQLPARGGAHRSDVVVGQSNALAVEFVEVRSFQDGVPVNGEFGVALVIGHHDDDVGLRGRAEGKGEEKARQEEPEAGHGYLLVIWTECQKANS